MSGVFDHLHLKSRTKGSSNELSFDVLDAARNDLEGRKSREPAVPAGRQLKGSYHGVKGSSSLSGHAEVEAHKRDRAKKNRRIVAVGAAVAVLAVAVLAMVAANYVQDRENYRDQVRAEIRALRVSDSTYEVLDSFMADPYSEDSEAKAAAALEGASADKERLQQIGEHAENLLKHAASERDSDALLQIRQGAELRESLYGYVGETRDITRKVDSLVDQMNATWNDVLDADQTARAAAEQANDAATNEQVEAARDTTHQALDQMAAARASLETFDAKYSEVDVSAQLDYLSKRIESLEHAVSTADALIAGDRDLAKRENDAYNAADDEAAAMARKLPSGIEGAARRGFAQQAEKFQDAYLTARTRILEIDEKLDAY